MLLHVKFNKVDEQKRSCQEKILDNFFFFVYPMLGGKHGRNFRANFIV